MKNRGGGIDDAIFRDQVSFNVGPEHHIVRISFIITFLEVCLSANTDHAKSQQKKNAKKVCNTIRLEIEQCLVSVSQTLHYGSGAGFYFGFYCTSCSGAPPAICDEDDPVVMSCKKCGSVDLKEKHHFWFGKKMMMVRDSIPCFTDNYY